MKSNEKKFIEDLKENGKRFPWQHYADKYFPGRSEKWIRDQVRRLRITIRHPKPVILKPTIIEDKSFVGPTPEEKLLLAKVKKDGLYATYTQMTQDFNPGCINPDWASNVLKKNNFVVKTKKATPQTQIEDRRRQEELNDVREQNKELSNQLLDMQRSLEKYVNIEGYDPKKFAIPLPTSKTAHEAAAILQWSDWHVEEEILSTTVNGVNSFNIKIAKDRSVKLFENGLKLVNTQRSGVDIKELIIHLGGDFITGYIHPEGEQTNQMSPINACKYAIDLISSGLRYYLENGQFNTIRVVCSLGNHGRTTKKMQSNNHEMNNELFIYYFLANHFKGEPRIVFQAGESSYSYMTVYNRVLRFFHGHQVRYQGGIGGMTVPMYKLILRLDTNTPAYYNFMGDKHVYCQPTPNCQVNGSLIGYNTYAAEFGLGFQEPMQAFSLIDSKRGVTIKAPIFVN